MQKENEPTRYSERVDLESVSGILADTGFSPQLPAYMRRLNRVLARPTNYGYGEVVHSVDRVSIVLTPDKNPTPIVEIQFNKAHQIRLDAYLGRETVHLNIGNGEANLAHVGLGNLQQFVRELCPDVHPYLFTDPLTLRKNEGAIEPTDFLGLTRESYEGLPLGTYQLGGGDLSFKLANTLDIRFKQPLCVIHRFKFSGTSQKVEQAIDLISQLFEKDPFNSDPKYFDQFLDDEILGRRRTT